jgi:hypothetical protein
VLERIGKGKEIPLGEVNLGKSLILLLRAWSRVQAYLFPNTSSARKSFGLCQQWDNESKAIVTIIGSLLG